MPNLTFDELARLRAWRTWLLVAASAVQGVQYALRPGYPLTVRAYAPLRAWREAGWVVFGVALVVVAVWLVLAPGRLRWVGFVAAAALYLLLFVSALETGLVSGPLLLPAGLCVGEIRARAWQRPERGR